MDNPTLKKIVCDKKIAAMMAALLVALPSGLLEGYVPRLCDRIRQWISRTSEVTAGAPEFFCTINEAGLIVAANVAQALAESGITLLTEGLLTEKQIGSLIELDEALLTDLDQILRGDQV